MIRVVLVASESSVITSVKTALGARPHELQIVAACAGVLEILEVSEIDFILVDACPTSWAVVECCHRLRATPRSRNTVVLALLSDTDGPDVAAAALAAGADDFHTKSSTISLMKRFLGCERSALRKRELVRAEEALREMTQEIESLRHAVAHDLRAPLRSIEGFSQALFEDCDDRLTDDGRKFLGYVRGSAKLMGRLIEGLITLLQVTRNEIRHDRVDLSALARATRARLMETDPHRQVEVLIQDHLVSLGDPGLLGIVIDSLLENAWKFSTPTVHARIELGADTRHGQREYFVRDNGVGFDMKYAGKLFGLFQRLHSDEFTGSGTGLATVRSIVHRHGGRVWAEGNVGVGATFHFSLPLETSPAGPA